MDEDLLELLTRSSVPGAKIVASKMQQAHLSGETFTPTEEEQRIINEARPPAADPDMQSPAAA